MSINLAVKRNWILFPLMSVITLLLLFFTRHYLLDDRFYYRAYGELLSPLQIEGWLQMQHRAEYLGYLLVLLCNTFKYLVIVFAFYIGLSLAGRQSNLNELWIIVLRAELVFFIPAIIKICWFMWVDVNFSLNDWLYFAPLSLLQITGYHYLSPIWIYPLEAINVFELAYWAILGLQLGKLLRVGFDEGLRIVLMIYLPLLGFWILLVELIQSLNPLFTQGQ